MALTINSYHTIWLTPDCSITNMAHTKLLQCGCDDGTDPMDHDGGWKASGEQLQLGQVGLVLGGVAGGPGQVDEGHRCLCTFNSDKLIGSKQVFFRG